MALKYLSRLIFSTPDDFAKLYPPMSEAAPIQQRCPFPNDGISIEHASSPIMEVKIQPPVLTTSTKQEWRKTLLVCIGCVLIWWGWSTVRHSVMPVIIGQIYHGKASPNLLNDLIQGQANKPLETYLTIWREKSNKIGMLVSLSLVSAIIYTIPVLRRSIVGLVRELVVRAGLFRDCQLASEIPLAEQNPALSRRRVILIAVWFLAFTLTQIFSVACFREWWPFSPLSMYSKRYHDHFEQLEVCGVQQNQLVLVAGRNSRLSKRLATLWQKNGKTRDLKPLDAYLSELASVYEQNHPDQPPLEAIQLRQIGWKMTSQGSSDDPPVLTKLFHELRLDDKQAAAAHTSPISSARR